jgi:DUF1680 family protein
MFHRSISFTQDDANLYMIQPDAQSTAGDGRCSAIEPNGPNKAELNQRTGCVDTPSIPIYDPEEMARSIRDRFSGFNVRDVKIGGEIGRRIDITVENNLLQLDIEEQFLNPFRERILPISAYIGLGKLLDSLVRFSAYAGNAEIYDKKRYVVGELLKTQELSGYIGIYPPDIRMWYVWDVHEMSNLVYGLASDYLYFGEKKSLQAAERLMSFMISRWKAEPGRVIGGEDLSPWLSTAGFDQALMALYSLTEDGSYLDFARAQRELEAWDMPIVVGRHGKIEGHVYLYLSRCLAQHEFYRITHEESALLMSDRVMDFMTRKSGMVISGACGQHECWHNNQDGGKGLGESCATAHLVWFMDSLLRLEGDSLYGDLMERIVYNTLFAAQSPDGRLIRYYTPFEGERVYFDKDTYCCPNNFRRIISDLPRMVYYLADEGLAVNLYCDSTLEAELEKGRKIRVVQKTDYPNSGAVLIELHLYHPASFTLALRIPRWCEEARITLNRDTSVRSEKGGRFVEIKRLWQDGDMVRLNLPMHWRLVKGSKRQTGKAAVMRGPVLFGLSPKGMQHLIIDPASLTGPETSNRIRPRGLIGRIKVREAGKHRQGTPDSELVLTEFADPDIRLTYLPVSDSDKDLIAPDELFHH